MVCVVVPNHSEQHVRGNFVAASPLCVAFSRRPEQHAPRTALRKKIRAQREQRGSIENQKTKKIKKKQKKTIFRNSFKYIWIGPESCNIVFFVFFDFFVFFGFFDFFVFFGFFELFWFFWLIWVKFVSPGCEGVALCIQECGPCVIVYSGMGAWECVKHEKVHSHSVPFCYFSSLWRCGLRSTRPTIRLMSTQLQQ